MGSGSHYNTREDHEAVERIASSFTKAEREELERLRLEKKIREGQADYDGLRALALYYLPNDLKAFAELHKLPTFVEQTWVQAFIVGWRNRVSGNDGSAAADAAQDTGLQPDKGKA